MTTTTVVDVEGMTCQHCVKAVTAEVSRLAGVHGVDVALDAAGTTEVTITSDGALDPVELREAIDEAGYDVAAIRS
jgi:copper chaperone CopZ